MTRREKGGCLVGIVALVVLVTLGGPWGVTPGVAVAIGMGAALGAARRKRARRDDRAGRR
jgi:uncharacterized membrane protein YccC